jgi:hypothetical protein
VQQLRYWINNGTVTAVAGNSAATQVSAEGTYNVGLRALDNAGNISSLASANFGIDVTPPSVSVSANPSSIWPPNGKLVAVTVSGTITDSLSGVNPASATFAVVDEYGQVQPHGSVTLGTGGSYSFIVSLQASRNGNDLNGRQYTITVRAQDLAGNTGSAATIVTVPHNLP